MGISNMLFILALGITIVVFSRRIKTISRNIKLGRDVDLSDNPKERWKTMALVALGQSKMVSRPIAGFMHVLIYVGFVLINIEVLEILLDGILGTHRIFAPALGDAYKAFINAFELLALGVLVSCVVFLIRRNILKLKRFWAREMTSWPRSDANIILVVEILLMIALLTMNAADSKLLNTPAVELGRYNLEHYRGVELGGTGFLISGIIVPWLPNDFEALAMIERFCWWFHILGIFAFLIYIPYSKHFHIFLSFPNVYYSKLSDKGKFDNLEAVKKEVELMMDPNADPYAAPAPDEQQEVPKFGAKDVQDLSWKQLMDAYSCTECGRCTSVCPANQTGKLLSPRKIMMDTRDRLEEVGKNIDTRNGKTDDGKALIHDEYITPEELWACTTCNACTEACPVNIDPLSIIVDLRRHLVMEESAAPQELNGMFSNVENNGAPWQFAQADRLKWAEEA